MCVPISNLIDWLPSNLAIVEIIFLMTLSGKPQAITFPWNNGNTDGVSGSAAVGCICDDLCAVYMLHMLCRYLRYVCRSG